MDDFTKRMIQNSARRAVEEMERKNRLDLSTNLPVRSS